MAKVCYSIAKDYVGSMPLLLICLVGLLVSVYASPVSPPMVAGSVRLANGSPVAGAEVVVFDVTDLRRGRVGQATTDEAGLFALPRPMAGGAFVLPREVGLGANYPNPFNPSTLIPYQLPVPAPVRLEVFNVLGQRVTTLVDGEQEAGAYRARWDGTDAAGRAAAAGVYFYRLTVAGAHWTGKMVLVDGQAGVPLAGARVEAVSRAAGPTEMGRYGLVVVREGVVVHVDSDFVVAAGTGSVVLDRAARPQAARAGKAVAAAALEEGVLGDVNADGRVALDDGLLVAMWSGAPALSQPNPGSVGLGDVNCNGQVELEDAGLIGTFVANAQDASVASLRIGQPGGYSLDPVMELIWASILGTEKRDATVAQILDGVPVLQSTVLPIAPDQSWVYDLDGPDHIYLGIDRDWWANHGGKHLYQALQQRFPITPFHLAPTTGIELQRSTARPRPAAPPANKPSPLRLTLTGPPLSFTESPRSAIEDHTKQQRVVGQITVPDDVRVGTVSVGMEIIHPARRDLKVDLVAPSGVVLRLYADAAAGSHPKANLITATSASPALLGQRAQGVWQLRVGDYEAGDAGVLNAWELTITPAQDTPETEDPVNLFLETFQEGLGSFRGEKWEATISLDNIPGEEVGNVVAQAKGCGTCLLTLAEPIDLSAHESVTFSFYRHLDPDMTNSEFLGVDVGNNRSYRRLKNWDGRDADGQWHRETFTLSGDDIGENFSIRFFGITATDFTTIAIDNVMIAATPGSVAVEPVEPPAADPDLAVTSLRAIASTPALPGQSIPLRATVVNTNAPAGTRDVSFYRHTQETDTPRTSATPVASSRLPLQTNSTRFVSINTVTPIAPGAYRYYACVDEIPGEETANNCAETTVTVAEPETGLSVTLTTTRTEIAQGTVIDDSFLTVTVTNNGDETVPLPRVSIYRHDRATATPRVGGFRMSRPRENRSLDPGESYKRAASDIQLRNEANLPATYPDTYYYYACAGNVCSAAVPIPVIGPHFTLTNVTVSPEVAHTNDDITVTATITNTGTKAGDATILIYRFTETTNPVKEPNSATVSDLEPNESVTITSTHTAPTVTYNTKFSYLVCVNAPCYERTDLDEAAQILIQPEDPGPPYDDGWCPPVRANPMGGDALSISRSPTGLGDFHCAGTISLGGVEDQDGTRGFITAGHVISHKNDEGEYDFTIPLTDTIAAHGSHAGRPIRLLGRGAKLPTTFTHEKVARGIYTISLTDAAFVAYPKDANREPLAPRKIRGKNGDVYTVIGSKEPVNDMMVWISGSMSGVSKHVGRRGKSMGPGGFANEDIRFFSVALDLRGSNELKTIGGDSGSPLYTAPDADGNVHILGVHYGTSPLHLKDGVFDYETYDVETNRDGSLEISVDSNIVFESSQYEYIYFYSPWDLVELEFNLKPIGESTRLATASKALSF